MATLAEHPLATTSTSASPMPTVNACYDPDIDSFLNLDQLTYTSKVALPSHVSVTSADFSASDVRSASLSSSSQSPMAFQAPSHQYDEHKQQTGLPPGALAHTMAFNQVGGMGFEGANQGFAMNGGMSAGNHLKREEAPMDFNTVPTRNPSEMDLESDNMGAVPAYFYSSNPMGKNQFVDPNALGGHEAVHAGPSTQVGRMYPGMHQQQAAMAKAAQQQKHHELLRHQQVQQSRMEEQVQQTGIPQNRPMRHPDPVVEERITRLLQQMRQNIVVSHDENGSPSSVLPQMAKAKKDEQDMDEDERLLASEEGKKLSSKERRQLRNKVSARAFRSRRKEYIGQLESEVAARTNEAHELRLQNRALFEENARLTDLARMLLSSPHFSTFLDELSVSGVPAPPQPQPQSQPQQQQQPPAVSQPPMQANAHKDVNANCGLQEFQLPQNPQVGMVVAQNQGIDVSAVGINGAGWNSGSHMNFGNTPVFAVLDVPAGPAIDTELLSGKSSSFVDSYLSQTKEELPSLERPPVVEDAKEESEAGVADPEIDIDESDPAFALFVDAPATSTSHKSIDDLFGGVPFEKACATYELVVEDESKEISAATMHRFERLCHSMEAAFQRVSMVTSHLL